MREHPPHAIYISADHYAYETIPWVPTLEWYQIEIRHFSHLTIYHILVWYIKPINRHVQSAETPLPNRCSMPNVLRIAKKTCTVNTRFRGQVLQIKLKEAMREYRQRTGERMTLEILAERAGLSRATMESLNSRNGYNARLSTIEKICRVLGCLPGQLLELVETEDGN